MLCWPDIWQRTKELLPPLGVLAAVIGYIAFAALLLWAPKIRERWLRIASRILGIAALVPVVVLLPAVLFGLALAAGNPPTQTRSARSEDGQEATLSYNAGFLGRDVTEVALKLTGCCRHTTIFWHNGPSSLDDVKMEWLDNRHLHLTYHARSADPVDCEQRVGEITIVCTPLAWPR